MSDLELEQRIADVLQQNDLSKDDGQTVLILFGRLLKMPKYREPEANWVVDFFRLDDLVFYGSTYHATGAAGWLVGGDEYDRFVAQFRSHTKQLEYCFVFFKETKNRNRVRLMSGKKDGQQFVEFFEIEGGANWWESTSRVAGLR